MYSLIILVLFLNLIQTWLDQSDDSSYTESVWLTVQDDSCCQGWAGLEWEDVSDGDHRLQGLWSRGNEQWETRDSPAGGETYQHIQIPRLQVSVNMFHEKYKMWSNTLLHSSVLYFQRT